MRLIVFLLTVALLGLSCATQKSRHDVSKFKKFYHNTTALYNGYFNANVLLEESFEQLEAQVEDNYNRPLEIYKYIASENPESVYDNLDRAIEKVSVVVHLHRVSAWTDDCYLLMGQAQFLKQDYETAQETFEYFVQEFDEDGNSKRAPKVVKKGSKQKSRKAEIKAKKKAEKKAEKERRKKEKERRKARAKSNKRGKKKKISAKEARDIRAARREQARQDSIAAAIAERRPEEKTIEREEESDVKVTSYDPREVGISTTSTGEPYDPQSYFLKHKPVYQEGVLWLAKTYVMRGNYDNARMYLKQLENSASTFKEIRTEIAAVEALSFIRQKNYESAIGPMRKASELASGRAQRARYNFILAQLLELSGNFSEASTIYNDVARSRPNFELEFYARMGHLRTQQLSGMSDARSMARKVKSMIRERKFEEYKGELYLTLGLIQLNDGERAEAIESFETALREGRRNNATRAEIYHILATLSYENEDYVKAKRNYDGVLTTMHKKDERFAESKFRSENLVEIADNLQVLSNNDSLLMVSQMSDTEKMALAKKLKREREEAKLQKGQEEAAAAGSKPATFVSSGSRPLFFAYDQKSLSKKKRDFDRKWQSRPLEDDWRRSATSGSSFDQEDGEDELVGASSRGISDGELQDLLAGVPNTPEEFEAMEQETVEALYALGGLFREKLDLTEKSVYYLERLLEIAPDNPYLSEVYYRLYVYHGDLGNSSRSEYFKDKILNDFPESLFAEVISDPDYFKKKKEEENKLNNYYASTYEYFSVGNYDKAYDMSSQATQVFGDKNNLKAKFALLRAMCVGKMQGADQYMHALREVVAKYPDTEEQIRAREILRLLGQRTGQGIAAKDDGGGKPGAEIFSRGDEEMHYVLIVLQSKSISLNDAKITASNYNNKYHRLDQIKISNIVLGEKNDLPVVVLRRFTNKKTAMKYLEGVQKNKKDFIKDPTWYEMFAVSQSNYRQLIMNRSIEPYREFFMANYMQ